MSKIEIELGDHTTELLEQHGWTLLAVRIQPPKGLWPMMKMRHFMRTPQSLSPIKSWRIQ